MRCKAVHHKSDAALCAPVHQREDIFLLPLPISHPDDKLPQSSRACHSRDDTCYTILGASSRAKSCLQADLVLRDIETIFETIFMATISRSPDIPFSFAFSARVARSKFLRFWQKRIKILRNPPLYHGEARRKFVCAMLSHRGNAFRRIRVSFRE